MACKQDITLAWGWLSLGDLDVDSLPEPGLDAEPPDPADPAHDPIEALEPLGQYLAVMNLGRFLQ
jgi:hypothetical protein